MRLAPGEPPEVDGHAPGGHLVVGDVARACSRGRARRSPRRRAPRRPASARSAPRTRITVLAFSATKTVEVAVRRRVLAEARPLSRRRPSSDVASVRAAAAVPPTSRTRPREEGSGDSDLGPEARGCLRPTRDRDPSGWRDVETLIGPRRRAPQSSGSTAMPRDDVEGASGRTESHGFRATKIVGPRTLASSNSGSWSHGHLRVDRRPDVARDSFASRGSPTASCSSTVRSGARLSAVDAAERPRIRGGVDHSGGRSCSDEVIRHAELAERRRARGLQRHGQSTSGRQLDVAESRSTLDRGESTAISSRPAPLRDSETRPGRLKASIGQPQASGTELDGVCASEHC